MADSSLRYSQLQMARYLRNPDNEPAPDVEPRRLKIYQDLIYNNIEGFISGGFPVLRSLYTDDDWHALVRTFIDGHRCHTPYFLEISQEFLKFLMQDFSPRDCDPPFIAELAHYEWVELALDVSEQELAGPCTTDPLTGIPSLSELAWVLSYQYPVHKIGPNFRPEQADEPTFLVVYRNRDDRVKFIELNAATARLLELVRENSHASGAQLLAELADELGMEKTAITSFGQELLNQFMELSILSVDHPSGPIGQVASDESAA